MPSYLTARTPEEWNAPAYAGKPGHVESYFFKGNDLENNRAFWIKFTIFSPLSGDPLGEVWAILFDQKNCTVLGAKESYPLSSCVLAKGKPIQMGNSWFTSERSEGIVATKTGEKIQWNLNFSCEIEPLALFPLRLMYLLPLPRSKTVTPYPDLVFSGTITSPLGVWTLEKVRGCQGHNWGKEHAYSYAWTHCNLFTRKEGIVYEGLSARVRIGKKIAPPLSLGALILPGGNTLYFRGLKALRSKEIEYDFTSYRFTLPGEHYILEGEAKLSPALAAGLTYYNPDGEKGYCLNSKTAELTIRLRNREGRTVEEFFSPAGAALEILTRDSEHPVRMIL